jgi:hypothetical protein
MGNFIVRITLTPIPITPKTAKWEGISKALREKEKITNSNQIRKLSFHAKITEV